MNAISTLNEHEKLIRQKFGVKRIGIFESFARGEEREDSDLVTERALKPQLKDIIMKEVVYA